MINTRTATLSLETKDRAVATSRIMLHSRSAGVYVEADLSKGEQLAVDDIVYVVYDDGSGERTLVATARVFAVPRSDSRNVIFASDLYRDRLKTIVPACAWRKADATEIMESVMADCDVDDFDSSALSGIRLPHFSCQAQNGWTVLRSLLKAVNVMEGSRFVILPSSDGILMIGEYDDLSSYYSSPLRLDIEDVMTLGEDRLTAHLVAAGYGQEVIVNGVPRGRVKEAVLSASADARRTRIWLE